MNSPEDRPVVPAPRADMSDTELSAALAHAAGVALLKVRASGVSGSELKDAGDATAHDVLVQALDDTRPDDAVLSEEGSDDARRLDADRVWIVDPLDGTREFSEPDRTDWAVHVALWERGELVAGTVGRPAAGVLHTTADPCAGSPGERGLRLVVSRSRAPEFVTVLADHLGAELTPMGSAGVKAMSVVTGETDAYVHAGGQYEWDSAAPVAVARAAGLHTSRIDGSPLEYNRADPWLPDLVICRPDLAERILAALAQQNAR